MQIPESGNDAVIDSKFFARTLVRFLLPLLYNLYNLRSPHFSIRRSEDGTWECGVSLIKSEKPKKGDMV